MQFFTEEGRFSLPSDFSFEIEITNPLFSDEGCASIPFSLPANYANRAAAESPELLSRSYSYRNKRECILQYGGLQLRGKLIVSSITSQEMSGTIALFESILYDEFRDKTLKDIMGDMVYKKFSSASSLIQWFEYNSEQSFGELLDDYNDIPAVSVFPVYGSLTENYKMILNVREDTSDDGGISYGGLIYESRTIKVGEDTYVLPECYGLVPHGHLWFLLEQLFGKMGYDIIRNDFKDEPFRYLTLINPVADSACYNYTLYYKDMVPDISINDFIEWLYNKFGAVVSFNDSKISIIILEKALSASPDLDITRYAQDDECIVPATAGAVSISLDTSLEGADSGVKNYNDWMHKARGYESIADYYKTTSKNKNYYVRNLGQIWNRNTAEGDISFPESFPFIGQTWNESDIEDLNTPDLYTPMHPRMSYHPSRSIPFIGDLVHFHTAIKNSEKEENTNHPIMVCWAYYEGYYRCGTVAGYNHIGNELKCVEDPSIKMPSLAPYGLFRLCWEKYNTMLLNSAPEISVTISFPVQLLQTMDITKPKLYKKQRVLIKSFSYTVSKDGIVFGQAKLQLIPNYSYLAHCETITL